jgi:hypothetical protein
MTGTIGEPQVVDAGRGAAWWGEGFRLFASSFWTWIGIMVIYLVISVVINEIPYVGTLGHWLLTPVFVGGLMIGCAALDRGEPLRVAHLFEGFQGAHFVPLMIIGAVNIALTLAMGAIAAVGVLGSIKLADMGRLGAGGDPLGALLGSAQSITGTGLLMTLVVLLIASVFAMLNWFAPALVALRGATAVDAMKASFLSCLRNWVPFLVYGLIAIAAIVAAIVVFGGLAFMLGAGAFLHENSGNWLAAAVVFFGMLLFAVAVVALVVGPVVFGSTYAGYKDTLSHADAPLDNPAYR